MIPRRSHQRRVKRAAHFERDDALGASLLARFARAGDGFGIARDHRLIGRVDVRGDREARLLRRLRACRLDLLGGEAEHGSHRPRPLLTRLLHQLAAPPHQLGRFGRGQRGRRDVRRVLAERMPRGGHWFTRLRSDDREHRGAVREYRRLRVLRRGEVLFGALEHELRQRRAERFVDCAEDVACRWKPLRQIFPHADFLRALPRAEPDRAYHRTTKLPQVKPAPKAHSITIMPGFRRPVLTASSSAIAMDAADVLPKRSTLT